MTCMSQYIKKKLKCKNYKKIIVNMNKDFKTIYNLAYEYDFYAVDIENDKYLTQNSFTNKKNIWDSMKHIY